MSSSLVTGTWQYFVKEEEKKMRREKWKRSGRRRRKMKKKKDKKGGGEGYKIHSKGNEELRHFIKVIPLLLSIDLLILCIFTTGTLKEALVIKLITGGNSSKML